MVYLIDGVDGDEGFRLKEIEENPGTKNCRYSGKVIGMHSRLNFVNRIQNRFYSLDDSDVVVPPGNGYGYYAFLIMLFPLYMLFFNTWALEGEMWAEMATNFFPTSSHFDLYERFFAVDSGYIPLLQRLIAAAVSGLGVSASITAYLYTWSAIILSAVIVGIFCLPMFRPLIQSDLLRFLVALVVLVFPSWETMTFINFVYVNVFIGVVIVALSLNPESEDAPLWMYLFPLLMFGKAYMFALVPILFLALFMAKPRYRIIFLITLCFAGLHIFQIVNSAVDGAMKQGGDVIPLADRLWAGWLYSVSLLGGYTSGSELFFKAVESGWRFWLGFVVLIVSLLAVVFVKSRGVLLIVSGLILVFGASFINTIALFAGWNLSLYDKLIELPIYRHTLTGFFGSMLVVLGFIEVIASFIRRSSKGRPLATIASLLLFPAWLLSSGWLEVAINNSHPMKFPYTNYSHWQEMASEIDSSPAILCVPVDPSPWMYRRNCDYVQLQNWGGVYKYDSRVVSEGIYLKLSDELFGKNIHSLGFRVMAAGVANAKVTMTAEITIESGEVFTLSGSNVVTRDGDLILLNRDQAARIKKPVSMLVKTNTPVKMYFDPKGTLLFDAMGNTLDEIDSEFDPAHFAMVPTEKLAPGKPIDLIFSPEYKADLRPMNGIGINFATHMKSNFGRARIEFEAIGEEVFTIDFSLSGLKDNSYRFFKLPEANYTSARITVLSGSGGVSVWKSHSIRAIARSCLIYEYEEDPPLRYTDQYTRRYTKGCPKD